MLRMIAELERNGRETARVNYGAPGLGGPPQRRSLAADGPRRQLGPGRPEVGQLADGCRLALDGPVGALRVHARRRVAARLRLAAPAGGGGVRARLARPGRQGRARHRAVLLARERVPRTRTDEPRPRPRHRRRRTSRCCASSSRTPSRPRRSSTWTTPCAARWRARSPASRRTGSGRAASSRSGARTSRSPSRTTGTCPTSSASIPAAASRPRRRPRSPRRCGARSSCGATTARAGRWPGR